MLVRIEEVIEQDEWESTHGKMWGWKARALNLGTDEQVFIALNSKPGNVLQVGTEFEFTPNGRTVGVYQSGKREQAGNRPQGTKAPAQAPRTPANAPTAPSRHVPTMTQAVAVLRECVAAVEGWGSDAHATTLFLGRLRGDIVRDPSPSELAAQQAAAQAKAEAEAAAAAKAAEEAAAKARAAQAYIPSVEPGDDSDIPF